jgi:hypothetical protein
MESSLDKEEIITISYEILQPAVDTGDKPKSMKVKKDFKLSPGTGAHLRIKTPYDSPFVLTTLMTTDTNAKATIRDILKGTVEVVVCGSMKSNVTLFAYIAESEPASIW